MGFTFKDTSVGQTDFLPLPAGNHAARCIAVIDLGTQKVEYEGEVKVGRRCRITWEVPAERMSDGRPFTISKNYKSSLHKQAQLRKDLVAWRNKEFTDAERAGFDPKQLLGKACMLTVTNIERSGKRYANVLSVNAVPKGTEVPKAENEIVFFDIEDFDDQVFEGLSKYARATIELSPEYQSMKTQPKTHTSQADEDEEIPF